MKAFLTRTLAVLGLTSASMVGATHAADWPTQPIRIVSPYPAGGSTDRVARVLSDYMSSQLGVSVVVENRVGGGSTIGSSQVVRAKPDGYTLLLSGLATYILAPLAVPEARINPLEDLSHIAYLGGAPLAMVAPMSSKAGSIKDLAAQAKAGDKLFYSTVGVGSVGHIAGEQISSRAKLNMVNVPYNTLNLTDVVEGRVPLAILAWTSVEPMVNSGRLKLLAVSGAERAPGHPETLTLKEQGVDLDITAWLSLSGPRGMPDAIVQRLNKVVTQMLSTPALREKLASDIFEVKLMTAPEFQSYVKAETLAWTPEVKAVLAAANK